MSGTKLDPKDNVTRTIYNKNNNDDNDTTMIFITARK